MTKYPINFVSLSWLFILNATLSAGLKVWNFLGHLLGCVHFLDWFDLEGEYFRMSSIMWNMFHSIQLSLVKERLFNQYVYGPRMTKFYKYLWFWIHQRHTFFLRIMLLCGRWCNGNNSSYLWDTTIPLANNCTSNRRSVYGLWISRVVLDMNAYTWPLTKVATCCKWLVVCRRVVLETRVMLLRCENI